VRDRGRDRRGDGVKLGPMRHRKRGEAARTRMRHALYHGIAGFTQAYLRELSGSCRSQTKYVLDELIKAGDVIEVWASKTSGGSRLYALTAQGWQKAQQR